MEGGYTIVALVAKQAAGQHDPSMPQVRDSIKATLQGRREQLLRTAYLETIRNRATIVNHAARRIVEAAQIKPPPAAPLAPK
jgi:peptidyl-prolyl cis-trans isomerase SurA